MSTRIKVGELTTDQKIEIIKGAQKLLGPKGENWIKGQWFGKKKEDFVPGESVYRWVFNYDEVAPSDADCWCLLGAMEESAHRLGYISQRRKAKTLGALTSIKKLAVTRLRKLRYGGLGQPGQSTDDTDQYNDYHAVKWKDIKKLMSDRIKELEKEV